MYRKMIVVTLAAVLGISTCVMAQEVAQESTQDSATESLKDTNNQNETKKRGGKWRVDTVARIHKAILEVQIGLKNETLSQGKRKRLDALMGNALKFIKEDKLGGAEKQLSSAIVIIYPERAEEIEVAAAQRLAERTAEKEAQAKRRELAEAQERELHEAADREKEMAAKRNAEEQESQEVIERETIKTAEIEKAAQIQLGVEHQGFVEQAARDEVEKALLQEMMAKAHREELKAAEVESKIRTIEQAKAIEKAEQAIREFEVGEKTETVQQPGKEPQVAEEVNGRDENATSHAGGKEQRETGLREDKKQDALTVKVKLPAEVQTKIAELEEAAKAMDKIGKSEIASELRDEAAELLRSAEAAAKQKAAKRSPGKNTGKKNGNKENGSEGNKTPSPKDDDSTIDIESLEQALNNVQQELNEPAKEPVKQD